MRVIGIYVAGERAAPVEQRDEVRAVAGMGLEGDRYFGRDGKSEVSLIEEEAVAAAAAELGVDIAPGQPRRNLVTAGVDLNGLVGTRFRVGDVLLEGTRLDHPCDLMERVIGPGARQALRGRGGLYARVVESGTIRAGDAVEILREAEVT